MTVTFLRGTEVFHGTCSSSSRARDDAKLEQNQLTIDTKLENIMVTVFVSFDTELE